MPGHEANKQAVWKRGKCWHSSQYMLWDMCVPVEGEKGSTWELRRVALQEVESVRSVSLLSAKTRRLMALEARLTCCAGTASMLVEHSACTMPTHAHHLCTYGYMGVHIVCQYCRTALHQNLLRLACL